MITRAHAHILPASLPRLRRLPRAVTTHGSGIALREWHQDQESEVSHIAIAAAEGLLPTDVDLSTSAGSLVMAHWRGLVACEPVVCKHLLQAASRTGGMWQHGDCVPTIPSCLGMWSLLGRGIALAGMKPRAQELVMDPASLMCYASIWHDMCWGCQRQCGFALHFHVACIPSSVIVGAGPTL